MNETPVFFKLHNEVVFVYPHGLASEPDAWGYIVEVGSRSNEVEFYKVKVMQGLANPGAIKDGIISVCNLDLALKSDG